jgi:glycosyltransferase involved in cell wall biosynthesis
MIPSERIGISQRKHILHIIDSLHPAAGGPSESVRALLTLSPAGCTGEAVTLDEPGLDFLYTYPFPIHALGKGSTTIGFSSKLDRWLERNRDRFDGFVVHGLWRYISFASRRALYRRKPYIVFAHGMLDPYFKRRFPLKRRFILFLGRIHRKKGCDLLVQAFIKIAPSDTELHLILAGPDQQGWSAQLQQAVTLAGLSHRVHWPGMLKGDVKWGALYAAEVFILPSHQENFGIAVAEALACGRAVLLSDKVNTATEIVQDGAGIVAPDTQTGTDDLLHAWLHLCPAAREQMQRAALECFDHRYDMRKNAEAVVRLFDEIRPISSTENRSFPVAS